MSPAEKGLFRPVTVGPYELTNRITAELRKLFPGPCITIGGGDGRSAVVVLSSGGADLVACGRPFIANPDLPERLRAGAPFNGLDPGSLHGGGEKGYTDYPFLD